MLVKRIKTLDADRFPLGGREHRQRSRDELLTVQSSGQTITRGSTWGATSGATPELDAKVGPIRDFVRGFVPGNVVHAMPVDRVISLGRVFLPEAPEGEERDALSRQLDAAELEWERVSHSKDGRARTGKRDARDDGNEEVDELGSPVKPMFPQGGTRDALTARPLRNYSSGTNRGISTSDYAHRLDAGRKDSTPAARIVGVTPAADYARKLAEGRAKMAK